MGCRQNMDLWEEEDEDLNVGNLEEEEERTSYKNKKLSM